MFIFLFGFKIQHFEIFSTCKTHTQWMMINNVKFDQDERFILKFSLEGGFELCGEDAQRDMSYQHEIISDRYVYRYINENAFFVFPKPKIILPYECICCKLDKSVKKNIEKWSLSKNPYTK